MSHRRPLIGVTASDRGGRLMWRFNCAAIRRAGGAPVQLTPRNPSPLRPLDGLVIGGGDDVDAGLYGGDLRLTTRIDPGRDALELRYLDLAARERLPVLGICRGAQIINVFRGGSLHGDIYSAYADLPRQRALLPRKQVTITPGTRLHNILGLTRCRVNSLHHQAVDRLGTGLRVAARDDHGIVQGLDAEAGTFLVGVQWHPEFLVHDRHQQRLFRALVQAAA